MSNGEDGNGEGRKGCREQGGMQVFLHPSPKPKSKVHKWVSFFSSHSSFFFFFFNISPVIIFPVFKQASVAASVTVINKVVVAGLLWDRWGSIWDLYVFQVEEA